MAFKMRYGRQGPPMYDKSFATKYGDTHMKKYKSHATLKGDLNKDGTLSGYERNRQDKIDESINKSKGGPTMKTPYEKNKHSHNTMKTPYRKHKAGREETTPQTVNPDKKRKQSIINKLKTLKDPVDSPEGKRLTNILMKDYNMSADGIESEVGFR